jgi:hypothetical protein
MDIKTKYNVKDKVFFTQLSKIVEAEVFAIIIPEIQNENVEIEYHITDKEKRYLVSGGSNRNWKEKWLYSSKEELIKSL